jgi:hypothetical protein
MRILITAAFVLATTGCAAILGSKQKDFNLNSNPPGADVYLNGNRLGSTPLKVKLSNQATHTFVFRRQGYQEATCTLNRGTGAGWVILDVLTGLVPVVIDAATNSWSQTKGAECSQGLQPVTNGVAEEPIPMKPAPVAPAPAPPRVPAQPAPAPTPAAPSGLVDAVPQGTNWIANGRTKTYYQVGCPEAARIPPADRLFYGSESSLKAAGFTRAQDC